MLVLSRKYNESIMIGDDIEITIVEIKDNKIRLGFDAPKNIKIHRREVYDKIKKEEMSPDHVDNYHKQLKKLEKKETIIT